ncbi:MAG: hypothetical protein DDT18_00313 [Actinobacteria bacterium]|uniref:DUF1858 domain-containing protein n=2 Tax=Candidatus Hakubella thermalkaliphila TaxID=2754717 RepID=UPI0021593691|nr:DUF1858 domain-containing protein [Candidatus Hakubella thermalkaliphila]MBT9169977.1 hypothetical protein [Actinomycetota bacterium]
MDIGEVKALPENSKITKDMIIEEVVNQYPQTVPIFLMHGLHCVGCHVSLWESIEQGALAHGIDIDPLMEDLNKVVAD